MTGFNDRSWLDRRGHTFTRPITFTQPNTLTPDGDLLEYFCTDNEQDSAHFK